MGKRWVTVVVVLAACGSKSEGDKPSVSDSLARMSSLADEMCGCKVAACADVVMKKMTTWSAQEAKIAPAKPTLSETDQAKANILGKRFTECWSKAIDNKEIAGIPPAPAKAPRTGDQVVASAFEVKAFGISFLRISYVRSDATLDPSYGAAEISYQPPRAPVSDRPLGAPPADDPAQRCPEVGWKDGKRSVDDAPCMLPIRPLHRPICTVAQVWKQAIVDGAPPNGLAKLDLRANDAEGAPQLWSFKIDDDARNVHFETEIKDACKATVEVDTGPDNIIGGDAM